MQRHHGKDDHGLKIGTAMRVISPARPELLTQVGMGRRQRTIGVLDDICVEALAFEVGGQAAFVAIGDLEVIKRTWEFRVRDGVARRTGRDEKSVLLAAVHNHSGSPSPWDKSDEAKAAWVDAENKIVAAFIDGCAEAWENRRPAEIAYGEARLAEPVGENRRMRMSTGVVAQCWGSGPICPPGQKLAGHPGPHSSEVRFLAVREVGRKNPFALLTAYPSHVHLANLPYFSGEFPGTTKRELCRRLNLETALYANNMAGDIDVHCVHPQPNEPVREQVAWFQAAQKILADRFADAVVPAVKRIKKYARPKTLTHRYWSTGDAKARENVDAAFMTLNLLALGDIAIAAMPGEIFLDYFPRLVKKSPFQKLLLLGYNGSDSRYIPTRLAWEMGGYEAMNGPGEPGEITKNVGLGLAMAHAPLEAGDRLEERMVRELRGLARAVRRPVARHLAS